MAAGALAVAALGLAACGDDRPRQDESEPEGEFAVEVGAAKFPTEQRLAKASDLELEIENTGDEQLPNLAVTIFTGDQAGGGPFSVRSDQSGLANPSRPVWILENGFPKLAVPGEGRDELDAAPTAGASAAQTDTFAFGPLDPGEGLEIVWRVTPVQAGTYTVQYEVAAGLTGKARAVTEDGSPAEGEFAVTIADKVPRVTVDDSGDVVIQGD